MANYAVNNANAGSPQNLAATYKTLVGTNASSGTAVKRHRIYDILLGTDGTPADNVVVWDLSRMTAAGTGTALTPNALDPADSASLIVGTANYTSEPTVTASSSAFNVGVNQRASYRWVAAPGSEFVAPATNLAGFVLRAKSPGYAGTTTGQYYFMEG